MTALITDANLADADAFYSRLIAIHDGRSKDESGAINARLILLLANHIGDMEVLEEALAAAAET